MSVWTRERAGLYVRQDGATVEKDPGARAGDYPWLVYGPGEKETIVYADTLAEAKGLADGFWPSDTKERDDSPLA